VVYSLRTPVCQLSVDRIFLGQHKQCTLEAFYCQNGDVSRLKEERGKASGRNSLNNGRAIPLGFVDANILADAILAQNIVDEITTQAMREHKGIMEPSKEIETAFKSYEPARTAFQFFLMLRAPKTPMQFVLSSNLALLEATSVIADEFVERRLSSKKVVRHSEGAKAKIRLSDKDRAQIGAGINLFRMRVGHALVIQDKYDFDIANRLVTQFACSARDAILVATALKNECPRFISRDIRLKRKLRRFKKVEITSIQTIFAELGIKTRFSS
jgi:predicted nucleic acid-binding protein